MQGVVVQNWINCLGAALLQINSNEPSYQHFSTSLSPYNQRG